MYKNIWYWIIYNVLYTIKSNLTKSKTTNDRLINIILVERGKGNILISALI